MTRSGDDRVRWGFLGAGLIARRALAPAVRAADGAVLHAVAARDRARAAGLGPVVAYGDYRRVLDDPDVDAVYIALPNDAHAPWTLDALDAGKPVLCEKPLGLTAAEVDEMAGAAARADRLLVEASWYRWHPRIRLAERTVGEGRLGRVRSVTATFSFAGSLEGNYRLDPDHGGGALYDVGCYAVSAALWAFGGAPVRGVQASSVLGPTGVDLRTEAVLTFDDGQATVVAAISGPDVQELRVEGDVGRMELPGPAFTAWTPDVTELVLTAGQDRETVRVAAVDPYRLMVEQFSAAVRGEPAWVLPVEQSRAVASVLDACRASAESA